jgi:hypothetical protein
MAIAVTLAAVTGFRMEEIVFVVVPWSFVIAVWIWIHLSIAAKPARSPPELTRLPTYAEALDDGIRAGKVQGNQNGLKEKPAVELFSAEW